MFPPPTGAATLFQCSLPFDRLLYPTCFVVLTSCELCSAPWLQMCRQDAHAVAILLVACFLQDVGSMVRLWVWACGRMYVFVVCSPCILVIFISYPSKNFDSTAHNFVWVSHGIWPFLRSKNPACTPDHGIDSTQS